MVTVKIPEFQIEKEVTNFTNEANKTAFLCKISYFPLINWYIDNLNSV